MLYERWRRIGATSSWGRLSSAQSLVFAFVEQNGIAPAELARRLGNTRQATHELVKVLYRTGLLDVVDDPARRGGRLVVLTDAGHRFAVAGYRTLLQLHSQLGARRVKMLRRLLGEFEFVPGAVRAPRSG